LPPDQGKSGNLKSVQGKSGEKQVIWEKSGKIRELFLWVSIQILKMIL
jgi:hypothetical protein